MSVLFALGVIAGALILIAGMLAIIIVKMSSGRSVPGDGVSLYSSGQWLERIAREQVRDALPSTADVVSAFDRVEPLVDGVDRLSGRADERGEQAVDRGGSL